MAFRVKIPPGGVIVVNGAVLRNDDTRQAVIAALNHVDVMREKNILPESEATTPLKKAYFAGQRLIIERHGQTEENIATFKRLLDELRELCRDTVAAGNLDDARALAENGEYYKAISALRHLFPLDENGSIDKDTSKARFLANC